MRLRPLLLASLGTALGLGLVEVGFHVRDHGAFPHLNIYVRDAKLGVRLRPGSTERISFSGNPPSDVRINSAGYRGADWPAHADNEIFVVGDSQAFGLGVNEQQSFASRLGEQLHRPVANAAVPTYGPDEYEAVLRNELLRRKPRTVLYTINIANDLFEASHPNPQRHTVWDGWAVRKETAPAHITRFPGRALLFRDSHAFFALRGAWYHLGDSEDGSVPSEGGWQELARAGLRDEHERDEAKKQSDVQRVRREQQRAALHAEQKEIDALLQKAIAQGDEDSEDLGVGVLHAAQAQPGDIVRTSYGEGSRPVAAVAAEIKRAADVRDAFAATLRARHDKEGLAALARLPRLDTELRAVDGQQVADELQSRSPLRAHLERVAALCKAAGAELVVVVLPLDVQVSKTEWAKYHAEPIDLAASRSLVEDVLGVAARLGARTVDAWPALEKAEPGAFLDGDLHMSPKGHQAVADAIALSLSKPARATLETQALPFGRSAVPTADDFSHGAPLPESYYFMSDLQQLGCKGSIVREWLRLSCKKARFELASPGRAEPMILDTADAGVLVVAMLEADSWSVNVRSAKRSYRIGSLWAFGEDAPETYVSELEGKRALKAMPTPTAAEDALCACWKSLGHADCSDLVGAADEGCAPYTADCGTFLACARGDASSSRECKHGVPTGVTRRCP
ncbi:MAG: hypothetical protein ABI321_04225 [Polyangia bacterium]